MAIAENKTLVTAAVDALFNRHDLAAIDRYFDADLVQHGALIAGGRDELRAFISALDASARYELVRMLGDGDLIATHGRYTELQAEPLVAFDVYKIAGGRIVEHWQGIQTEAGPNPSGHTMLDGPAAVTAPEETETTRTFLDSFVEAILLGQQFDRFTDFIGAYIQHNPAVADGLEGLSAVDVTTLVEYRAFHLGVVEGEFGLLVLDGLFDGKPSVYYDLFRVENNKIEEHWDVIEAATWE